MIKRILVPIDLSENSLVPLDQAVDLAKRYEAEVFLVHVIEPVYFTGAFAGEIPVVMAEVRDAQERQANAVLDKVVQRLRKEAVPCRALITDGSPYLGIVEAARQNKADVIVMATHGRTGVSHLFLGSVAERVVRTADCPVLTVRSKRAEKTGAGSA
jgi:nucleotide-binding universal stress UspA family protein